MAGIYIHIPFCKQACTYCDFFFETSQKHRDRFVPSLLKEIEFHRDSRYSEPEINTIYLGGGTPSRLKAEELNQVFNRLNSVFRISGDAEITMEVNPDDLSPDYLNALKKIGINRLSVGVQTFNPDRLKFMNRAHSADEAVRVLKWIADEGFYSWTADLIYGNPGQSEKDLREDTERLLSFNPPHISAYTLTVEPHTRLGNMVRKNLVEPADEDEVSSQMNLLTGLLEDAGVIRYEVSNFARSGHESRHNSAYWTHENYLGLGPSSHSFRWEDEKTGARWQNKALLRHYVDHPPEMQVENHEILNLETMAEERLLTGLRTVKGVTLLELESRYNYQLSRSQQEYLTSINENGYLTGWPEKIALSPKGLAVADRITLECVSRK